VNGKACFEKKSGSLILLIGVLSVVFCGIYDSGIGLGWIQSSIFLSHFGATVLIFCQGLVNAKLFAKTFKRAQRLTNHLKEEVESQTYELRRQKEEIEAQKLALSDAHVQLQEIDQTKTAFFRQISHELRTPLTLILGSLNLAIQSADWLPNARVALRNSRRLLRLVNQLLDFQRITQSRHAERQVVFDVPAISRTIAGLFGPACLERRVDFAFVDQGEATGELLVLGQVDALEKIAFNYLSNALKHSMEGGKIFFRIYRHHEFCRLEVEDTGPGIPVTELDKLFRTFARIQDADGVIRDSTGIGLALCRELTEAMGGQVGVRSELGKGSVFWADLPLANRPMEVEVALAAESLEEAVESLQHRAQIHLSEFEGSSDRTQIVEHPSILGAPTILVVDDQIDLRILIQRILVQVPYNVLEAGDGQEAFAILQRIDQHVDLVLADWMMPRCNGPELVKKMKSSERYRSVPVVLLTAKGDADARTEAVAVGANSYLSKPFDEVELLSTIANLLRLKQKERELIEMQKYLTQQVLQRFLPSSLVNKILAGEAILEQNPRMLSVTVMFSDLCGFTSTTEELGPRRVAEVLNEFLVEMTEVVFAFRGTVDKFIGDAILVVFGAPEELDAAEQIERASRCAIEMVKRLKQLNVGWEEKGLPQFRMRVGIHHGPSIVGSFGGPKRSDFTVIGHAVNIASRVQGVAEPNSIFVTQIVRDFLSHDRWEDAGRHRLKGVSQEIHLYRLKI
jgi:class 3 adenylate cyclase/signal transduction histidine kinase/CheY-like chemotaxis protein